MSKLVWDQTGEHFYETGVDQGVLFVYDDTNHTYGEGVAWNGLTAVNQNPTGADANALYADNIKYLNLFSNEEFGCTIEAYTYPDEFAACNGEAQLNSISGVNIGQQPRKMFGFSYRTKIGNDVVGSDLGYKIHLVYGAMASPSDKNYETINDNPDAINFSWEVTTTPIAVGEGYKPTAHIEIDSTKFNTTQLQEKLTNFENWLYGTNASGSTEGTAAQLPLPAKVIELLG